MPLLSQDVSCQVQVKAAKASYKHHFGREPRGIWLPECAYRPSYEWSPPVKTEGLPDSYPRKGVEEFLSENGLQYFFVDSATLKGGKAIGVECNVLEEKSVQAALDAVIKEFGGCDVLINGAGGNRKGATVAADGDR